MSFCPRCGSQVSDQAIYCPSCGADLKAAAIPESAPPQSQATPPVGPPYSQSTGYPPYATPGGAPYRGAPPAGGAAYPPPPKKSKKGCVIALLITLVVLLVGAGLAVSLGIWVFKTVKGPVDTTNKYIEAINGGDLETAWNLLYSASPKKRDYTKEEFDAKVVKPNVNYLSTWNAYSSSISDDHAQVKAKMTPRTEASFEVVFDLRKEGGEWKIFDYYYE